MKIKTLLALAAATLALAACNKQPEPTPATDLSVNPTSHEFPAVKAGDDSVKVFAVTSNTDWSATAPADVFWFSVVEANGKGNGNFKVILSQSNPTDAVRSAKVTVRAGSKTEEVTISQAAKDAPKAVTIQINDAQQFVDELLLKDHSTIASRDTTFEITSDLDFADFDKVPQYKGVFYANIDGKNHKISNWRQEGYMIQRGSSLMRDIEFAENCTCLLTSNSGGIFLEANYGGKVINITNRGSITIETGAIQTSVHRGSIMGINRAYIEKCVNYGPITIKTTTGSAKAQIRIGGVVGSFAASQDPLAMADVKGKTEAINCENHGFINVTAEGTFRLWIGGIFGFIEAGQPGQITGCKNDGNLSASAANTVKVYMGGFIGAHKGAEFDDKCPIKNCENNGDVDGGSCVEGHFGGLLGYRFSETVSGDFTIFENCTAKCTVKAAKSSEGGEVNPCAYAGMVYGINDTNTAKITFGSTDAPIHVGGKIVLIGSEEGDLEVPVNDGNLNDLTTGTKSDNANVTINATVLK